LRTTNGLWALRVNALGTREFADLHADIHVGVSARKQECDKAVGVYCEQAASEVREVGRRCVEALGSGVSHARLFRRLGDECHEADGCDPACASHWVIVGAAPSPRWRSRQVLPRVALRAALLRGQLDRCGSLHFLYPEGHYDLRRMQ